MPKWSSVTHPPESRHMQGRWWSIELCGKWWAKQEAVACCEISTLWVLLDCSALDSDPPFNALLLRWAWHQSFQTTKQEHEPKVRLWWHALETCDTWHWAWRTLKGKRRLWLWVPVWIKGSVVYTLLSATGKRQEIGSAWGSTQKQPKYWHLEDTWAAFYCILFLRRGILLPAGECTKCFFPVTS